MKPIVLGLALAAIIPVVAIPHVAKSQGSTTSEVVSCVERERAATTYRRQACTTASARCGSREIFADIRRSSSRACLTATPGFSFIGAANIQKIACLDGRCRYDGPELTQHRDGSSQLCITAHTWSHSEPFRGGGHAEYRLCSDVERAPNFEEVLVIVRRCAK